LLTTGDLVRAIGGGRELRPGLVALAKRLRRHRPKGGQLSLRDISAELS
jgi:hypothetical protein